MRIEEIIADVNRRLLRRKQVVLTKAQEAVIGSKIRRVLIYARAEAAGKTQRKEF